MGDGETVDRWVVGGHERNSRKVTSRPLGHLFGGSSPVRSAQDWSTIQERVISSVSK